VRRDDDWAVGQLARMAVTVRVVALARSSCWRAASCLRALSRLRA
jgi:hypothetical protein